MLLDEAISIEKAEVKSKKTYVKKLVKLKNGRRNENGAI